MNIVRGRKIEIQIQCLTIFSDNNSYMFSKTVLIDQMKWNVLKHDIALIESNFPVLRYWILELDLTNLAPC